MKKNFLFLLALLLTLSIPWKSIALDTPGSGGTYSYPLPATAGGLVNIVYTMAQTGSAQILAYNESGEMVVNFNDLKPAGLQTSQVSLCCLAPGVYVYLILIHYDNGQLEKLKPGKFVVIR